MGTVHSRWQRWQQALDYPEAFAPRHWLVFQPAQAYPEFLALRGRAKL